jgi:hypothetical protein
MKLELNPYEAGLLYELVGRTTSSDLSGVYGRLSKLIETNKERVEKLVETRAKHERLLKLNADLARQIATILEEIDALESQI